MKYKITYLKDTSENTEETPVMDLSYWYGNGPCDEAERIIREQRPDLLESITIDYDAEDVCYGDKWLDFWNENYNYIVGDIVNWKQIDYYIRVELNSI